VRSVLGVDMSVFMGGMEWTVLSFRAVILPVQYVYGKYSGGHVGTLLRLFRQVLYLCFYYYIWTYM
jgi:hypothetical protein